MSPQSRSCSHSHRSAGIRRLRPESTLARDICWREARKTAWLACRHSRRRSGTPRIPLCRRCRPARRIGCRSCTSRIAPTWARPWRNTARRRIRRSLRGLGTSRSAVCWDRSEVPSDRSRWLSGSRRIRPGSCRPCPARDNWPWTPPCIERSDPRRRSAIPSTDHTWRCCRRSRRGRQQCQLARRRRCARQRYARRCCARWRRSRGLAHPGKRRRGFAAHLHRFRRPRRAGR